MRIHSSAIVIASVASALFASNSVNAAVLSTVENPSNGKVYAVITPNTWTGAEAEAESLGGHLVTISNADENTFIVDNIIVPNYSANPMWIGLYDPYRNDGRGPASAHAANFVWISGQPKTYTNWYLSAISAEPNNDYNLEYWGCINWPYADGQTTDHGPWNDTANNGAAHQTNGGYYGIVEFVPEPASLGLLAIGSLILMARRRV
jgi:hypothetical protein